MKLLHPRLLLTIPLALAALVPVASAHADYGRAQYQIAMSGNCDNPSFCGSQLGGFWGWAALYTTDGVSGTGDAQLTGCGHTVGFGGPGLAGAGHQSVDFTWVLGQNGDFIITSETDVFTGHGTPQTLTIPSEYSDSGVPLYPGHYSLHPAPGVSTNIQVNYIPTH